MFGKKEEKKAAAASSTSGGEKPCCSGKKAADKGGQRQAAGAAAAAASASSSKEEAALSTFMFGGAVQDGEVPLVGLCKGDPAVIQACVWSPGAPTSSGSGKKGSKKGKDDGQRERFTIIF